MSKTNLTVIPVQAPIQDDVFPLIDTIIQSIQKNDETLHDGDIIAISSKYVAISENRVVNLDSIEISPDAYKLEKLYNIHPKIAQLVIEEADHIFGGIQLGFLLTHRQGIISPNAGLDRSNIPAGKVVLLPKDSYRSAQFIRDELKARLSVDIGVIVTDSWLMPGRFGTIGVAVGTAGFQPIRDERGKEDLFGNPMAVTQVSIADSLSVCAQMVMGERDEATAIAIIRDSGVLIEDVTVSEEDISIPWQQCIYIESLTKGLLQAQENAIENSVETLLSSTN